MTLKARLKRLEQTANAPGKVDVVAILHAARKEVADAFKAGWSRPDMAPLPPEWEHSRNPLEKALFAARKRVGQ